MEELRDVVARVFREQFETAKLIDTIIEPDVDHDGDDILRIKYVFDVKNGDLDIAKVKSLIRHLREPLEALDEERFPVIRFLTTEEYLSEAA